jgi:hypothetical protein
MRDRIIKRKLERERQREKRDISCCSTEVRRASIYFVSANVLIKSDQLDPDTPRDIPFIQTDAQISASNQLILRNITIIFIVVITAYSSRKKQPVRLQEKGVRMHL